MKTAIKNTLLWVAVLPASLVGMILSFGFWRILHNLIAARYINTHSWLNIFFVEIMSNMVAGATFVLIGYKVAPNNKKTTAVTLTALLLLIGGSSLFIVNFISKEYFSNIGIIAGIFSSIVCCISVCRGEFDKAEL